MKRSAEVRNITILGFVAGLIYTLLADDVSNPAPVLNALLIGTIGGFMAGIIELYLFQPRVSRPEFARSVFLKVIVYFFMVSLLILAVKGSVDSFFQDISLLDYYTSQEFRYFLLQGEFRVILLYAFAIIFLIIFSVQINKYLGRGVLYNIITGRYHSPRNEARILLLIDMKGSTSIAEKLDPVSYFMLLDKFYFDVFQGARSFGGVVYRYVGDQVTLTWPVGNKSSNANCIRAFFGIRHQIHTQREAYLNQFGFVPDFKGTAHTGELTTGELGDLKSQIVYLGAPLLEVSHLEKLDDRKPDGLCISGTLLEILDLPADTTAHLIEKSNTLLQSYEIAQETTYL